MGFYTYNEPMYNEHQYNADTVNTLQSLLESITPTDATLVKAISIAKLETVTGTDARTTDDNPGNLSDVIFLEDQGSRSISDKSFPETIRLSIWLKLKLNSSNPWGD